MFSSNRDDWETPQELWDELDREFHFELDAAANEQNHKLANYYSEGALEKAWGLMPEDSYVWLNPPYGREIGKWVEKAYNESQNGAPTVCLLPARTDTKWFHDFCLPYGEIRFIRGRLKFVGAPSSAPFPSMIVIFRPKDAQETPKSSPEPAQAS